jgi:flagellar L-ring protein precursor FlgH
MAISAGVLLLTMPAAGQLVTVDEGASSSLMSQALRQQSAPVASPVLTPSPMEGVSLFFVPPPEPRFFQKHDLIQIIVRETSTARSSHELETEKEFNIDGKISAWPDFNLEDLLNLQLFAGRTTDLPELRMRFGKEFEGDGEYERQDDLVARLTAEVIEVLPNGNLVLEARTSIQTDEETAIMKVTGMCRPEDVGPSNTVLSSQIHDLKVTKEHTGELKKANKKGIIARVFDVIFAW